MPEVFRHQQGSALSAMWRSLFVGWEVTTPGGTSGTAELRIRSGRLCARFRLPVAAQGCTSFWCWTLWPPAAGWLPRASGGLGDYVWLYLSCDQPGCLGAHGS